jgi:putative ABC transport system substrate-binding protein
LKRRAFITLLGGAAAWPLAVSAQQPAMPVIGFLNGASPQGNTTNVAAFQQSLKETDYVEGRNLTIEYRWAEGQYDRLPALAADLVRRQVTVMAAIGTPAALAAKAATATIPIAFTTADDPMKVGLVASLNRPGGNITGVTTLNVELAPKLLELLHEMVPNATVIGLLVNPDNSAQTESTTREVQIAARKFGIDLHILNAGHDREFDAAFASLARLHAGALVIAPDLMFASRSEQLGALAFRHVVPAIYPWREAAVAGGLMSYGSNVANLYRQVGMYTSRILKGEKPADLPVQQAVKLDLVINLKTAKALGLEVPMSMLMRVDEVIE